MKKSKVILEMLGSLTRSNASIHGAINALRNDIDTISYAVDRIEKDVRALSNTKPIEHHAKKVELEKEEERAGELDRVGRATALANKLAVEGKLVVEVNVEQADAAARSEAYKRVLVSQGEPPDSAAFVALRQKEIEAAAAYYAEQDNIELYREFFGEDPFTDKE